MCELFFAQTTNGASLKDKDVSVIARAAADSASFQRDGWGVFNRTHYYKSGDTMSQGDVYSVMKMFGKGQSDSLVLHTRTRTSGPIGSDYSHPFVRKGWMLAHNGMYDYYRGSETVDSDIMLKDIVETPAMPSPEKIEEGLKGSTGVASVFTVDRSKTIYYFKFCARFTFVPFRDKNVRFGATSIRRLRSTYHSYTGLNLPKENEWTPKEDIIYEMSNKQPVRVGKIDRGSTGYGQVKTVKVKD